MQWQENTWRSCTTSTSLPTITTVKSLYLREEEKNHKEKTQQKSPVFSINVSLHERFILSRKIVSIQPDIPFPLRLEIILHPNIYILKGHFFRVRNLQLLKGWSACVINHKNNSNIQCYSLALSKKQIQICF